ncbi:hypothetical protein L210DRAFT_3648350 [Boletus edulis BED1]|uniref:Uncharacterized protein n=1 Tax=Boletus edulis BED1 TaxID=1328754 RepID=A0AAD4GC55_BOLED|nr:hypothetical protein L210DRAFT_3648350 [Boletus edulis BED1]
MPTTSTTKSTPPSHDTPSARIDQGVATKEVRAHEHARHRTKERREHALTKERKEKAAALSMESWDGEEPKEARSAQEGAPRTPVQALGPELGSGHDVRSSFTELTLGDLISKPRRPKAKQLDFEVIPPIRAVIALDDAEADEPWEYITRASLNDAWKGKSYAQAVASAILPRYDDSPSDTLLINIQYFQGFLGLH